MLLAISCIGKFVRNKFNKLSHELDNLKKEFYFVGNELNSVKEKNNYIEYILLEVEQDSIENYKHLDDKIHIFNRQVSKELRALVSKDVNVDTMG